MAVAFHTLVTKFVKREFEVVILSGGEGPERSSFVLLSEEVIYFILYDLK